jgi:hypothetical protein
MTLFKFRRRHQEDRDRVDRELTRARREAIDMASRLTRLEAEVDIHLPPPDTRRLEAR